MPATKETASAVLRSGADVMAVLVAVAGSLREFHARSLADLPPEFGLDEADAPGTRAGRDDAGAGSDPPPAAAMAEAPGASTRVGRPHASARLGPSALLDQARLRVESGAIDPAAFDPPYRRYSPEELLDLAERGRPDEPVGADLVTVVGSARLDTVLLDGERATVWIIPQGGAVGSPPLGPVTGDRYRDLATMAVDLAAQVSPEALGPFLDAYGLDHHDVLRLDWHVLIDQLLR